MQPTPNVIERNLPIPPIKNGRRRGYGETEEYKLGGKLYFELGIGDSILLENVDAGRVLGRIRRLNKQALKDNPSSNIWKVFKYRTESENSVRFWRVD